MPTCAFCRKTIPDKQYKIHIDRHTDCVKKKYKCSLCNNLFGSLNSLKRHKDRVHQLFNLKRNYRCLRCDLNFKTRSELESHRQSFHSRIREYQCEICNDDRQYSKNEFDKHKRKFHMESEVLEEPQVTHKQDEIQVIRANGMGRTFVFGDQTVILGNSQLGQNSFDYKVTLDLDRLYNIDKENSGITLRQILQFAQPNTSSSTSVVNEMVTQFIKGSSNLYHIRKVFTDDHYSVLTEAKSKIYNCSTDRANKNSSTKLQNSAENVYETSESDEDCMESVWLEYNLVFTSDGKETNCVFYPNQYYKSEEFLKIKESLKNKVIISVQENPYYGDDDVSTYAARSMMEKDQGTKLNKHNTRENLYRKHYLNHFVLYMYSYTENLFFIFDPINEDFDHIINEYRNRAVKWAKCLNFDKVKWDTPRIHFLNFQGRSKRHDCGPLLLRVVDLVVHQFDKQCAEHSTTNNSIDWIPDFVCNWANLGVYELQKLRQACVYALLKEIPDFNPLLQVETREPRNVSTRRTPRRRHFCKKCQPETSYLNEKEFDRHVAENIHKVEGGHYECGMCKATVKRYPHAHFKICSKGDNDKSVVLQQ